MVMKKLAFILMIVTFAWVSANAQVGIGTTTPDPSSQLDVTSTSRGLLVPRMDSSQRTGITDPAIGLLVYQTNGLKPGFYYYSGTSDGWKAICQNHFIGEYFGGGVVFYVDHSGQHGLICSMVDVNAVLVPWSTSSGLAEAYSFWDGLSNTNAAVLNGITGGAISACTVYVNDDYGTGVFEDWYLPAVDEFRLLVTVRYVVDKAIDLDGDITTTPLNEAIYWTSTEKDIGSAFEFDIQYNFAFDDPKTSQYSVRAIRAF